jgi:hypothetical protein
MASSGWLSVTHRLVIDANDGGYDARCDCGATIGHLVVDHTQRQSVIDHFRPVYQQHVRDHVLAVQQRQES